LNGRITRVQLQRLMDEDKAIRLLLGTGKARDVIKKFKHNGDSDGENVSLDSADKRYNEALMATTDVDDVTMEAIHGLQETVFSRLEKLEKSGLDVDATEVPQIKFISNQLADLFADIQNGWREGITGVLECATIISSGLLSLTKGVEQVSGNHNKIMETLCVDDSSDGSEEEGDYTSGEEQLMALEAARQQQLQN